MNAPFRHWTEESGAFSEEETVQVLRRDDAETLDEAVREKLQRTGLLDDFEQLSRNLKAIIDR